MAGLFHESIGGKSSDGHTIDIGDQARIGEGTVWLYRCVYAWNASNVRRSGAGWHERDADRIEPGQCGRGLTIDTEATLNRNKRREREDDIVDVPIVDVYRSTGHRHRRQRLARLYQRHGHRYPCSDPILTGWHIRQFERSILFVR